MKKRTLFTVILSAVMIPLVFVSASAFSPDSIHTGGTNTTINSEELQNGVLRARLGQMLNMNFVYNEDFLSDKAIIENAQLALLKFREGDEIEQALVLSFIAGMYGRTVDSSAAEYDFLPAQKGYFAILPRGYSELSHEITEILQEEDGITVFSNMKVNPHDNSPYTVTVKTVFVPNQGSSFGYNIISSDILEGPEL